MNESIYTEEELAEFDELISLCDSLRQMDRITGRGRLREFIAKHGDAKCDAMFKKLTEPEPEKP